MKIVLYLLLALAGTYVLFGVIPAVIAFFRICRHYELTPYPEMEKPEAYFGDGWDRVRETEGFWQSAEKTRVSVKSQDGTLLWADRYDFGGTKTALLMHGFGTAPINNFACLGRFLAREGYDLLVPEERGHGESGGRPTLGLREADDVLAWLDTLKDGRSVVCGVSMGAAAIAYASKAIDPARAEALVLDCGFASPCAQMKRELVSRHVPAFLLMPTVTLCLRLVAKKDPTKSVREALTQTRVPCFFLHGENDEKVPADEGKENFRACGAEKQWLCVPKARHGTAMPVGGEAAEQKLKEFLENCGKTEERAWRNS